LWLSDNDRIKNWVKYLSIPIVCLLTFPSDWSCVAAMAILFMGTSRGNFKEQMQWMMVWTVVYAAVYFFFLDRVYALVQLFTCLSIPILKCYNGRRGQWKGMGKLFYVYYPAHLVLCGILRIVL
jgi:hypothetical protein